MLAGANVVGGPGGAGATGGTYTKLVAGAVAQVATQCCSARAAGPPAKTAKANRNGLMTFIVYFSSNFANTRLCWCASRCAASDERHAPSIKFVRLLSNLSAGRAAGPWCRPPTVAAIPGPSHLTSIASADRGCGREIAGAVLHR